MLHKTSYTYKIIYKIHGKIKNAKLMYVQYCNEPQDIMT